MKIYRTFEKQTQGVYLAKFVRCTFYKTPIDYETELDKTQDELQDPLYLRDFIKSPSSGWKLGHYKKESLSSLVLDVLHEAGDLFDKLDDLSEQSLDGDCFELLFDNFQGLSKLEKYNNPGRRKMYTYEHSSLLRLYGVLLGNNCFIVTGGGIKLVDTMQETKLLQQELNKMNYLIDWLEENNITDCTFF